MSWYQKTAQSVLEELGVKEDQGLSYDQAAARLKTFGPNILASKKRETLADIFVRQFKSPLIYILIFAAFLVLLLGQSTDALVILAVIIVNALVGTVQEGKANNSLARLKTLTKHKNLVRRNGQETIIPSEDIVPGDILILYEGDKVAADARIINAQSLTIDEAILTGEAYPVAKSAQVFKRKDLILSDQKNMAFAGTNVTSGYAEAVVVETGFDSELGRISKELLETASVSLPLNQKVLQLSHLMSIAVLNIALLIFIIGVVRGISVKEITTAVIGLSVSVIPEGLPVAVTIVLAGGVWRMAKSHAIVRQMAAVEAMGDADTLLVDKTGTITTGQMVIKKIYFNGHYLEVGGQGYEPDGKIISSEKTHLKNLEKLLKFTYLSVKGNVIREDKVWKPIGDPTEAAIAVLCRKIGLSREKLQDQYKTEVTKPFDSQKRYIEAVFSQGREKWYTFIGAPEFISYELKVDHQFSEEYHDLAQKGLRLVGVALYGPTRSDFFGYLLLAIEEEIRENVANSIAQAQKAGFRVVMMTGDFPETAKAIAAKIGILKKGDQVLTGTDVERLSEGKLAEKIDKVSVFARITPNHKLKIVNVFKRKGHVVAMTGDGVNDAPALQAANLGIGLGSGTQVAKDSSDIVLVDDNFATITASIAEGRGIHLTLKKVILYLFSTSLGEVLVILASLIIGLPLPLVAVQIIWLNFITDGFLVVALAQDPPESGLPSRTQLKGKSLVDSLMIQRSLFMGGSMLVATLPLFYIFLHSSEISYARSIALLILSITQWLNALNVRASTKSIFQTSIINNWYLIAAFCIVIFLQYLAIQTPFGNKLLHTSPLTVNHWLLALFASTLIIIVEEIRKFFVRSRNPAKSLSPSSTVISPC